VNAAEQGDTAKHQAEHHECGLLQGTASEVTPNWNGPALNRAFFADYFCC
jgi:hypothetical protein